MNSSAFEKEYFSEMYDGDYDKRNPSYKFKSYFREIRPFIPRRQSFRLLDIGCAYGSFLQIAKEHGEVVGSDISAHAVKIARERLPGIKIIQADILTLTSDQPFDVITCFDILEHVHEINQALTRIRAMLSEDGILVLTIPVYDTIVGKMVERLDKDPTHIHKNSRYWWIDLIRNNQFIPIYWTGIWRYYVKNIFYLHFLSHITRNFSPAIMIIARKK